MVEKQIGMKKPIFPKSSIDALGLEERVEGKVGDPTAVFAWIDESEESKEVMGVLERLDIAYFISHHEGEERDRDSLDPIERIPLPALHLGNNGWISGIAKIKYFIRAIEPMITNDVSREKMGEIRIVMKEIRKEAKEAYGKRAFLYGGYCIPPL